MYRGQRATQKVWLWLFGARPIHGMVYNSLKKATMSSEVATRGFRSLSDIDQLIAMLSLTRKMFVIVRQPLQMTVLLYHSHENGAK